MMADPYFLKSLVDFDKDGLNERQVRRVKGDYMRDAAFTVEGVRVISTAGAGACVAGRTLARGGGWLLDQPRGRQTRSRPYPHSVARALTPLLCSPPS